MNHTGLQTQIRDLTRRIALAREAAGRSITAMVDKLRRRASALLPQPGALGQPRPTRRIIQQPRRWGARQPQGWMFRRSPPFPVPVFVEDDWGM